MLQVRGAGVEWRESEFDSDVRHIRYIHAADKSHSCLRRKMRSTWFSAVREQGKEQAGQHQRLTYQRFLSRIAFDIL